MLRQSILALIILFGLSQSLLAEWIAAGDISKVHISSDKNVTIFSKSPTTAGVLSQPINLPEGCDAIMIRCRIENDIPANAVVFSVHTVSGGETIAYWQNPVARTASSELLAVLRLDKPAEKVRVFIGIHNRPADLVITGLSESPENRISNSKIEGDSKISKAIPIQPLRVGIEHHGSVYGAPIQQDRCTRQLFTSTGLRLGALKLRVYPRSKDAGKYDFIFRLYIWAGDFSRTLKGKPVLEYRISGQSVVGSNIGGNTSDTNLAATYSFGAVDIFIPLGLKTRVNKKYIFELSAAPNSPSGPLFGSYSWVDGYSGGNMFVNNRELNWDLFMELYDAEW